VTVSLNIKNLDLVSCRVKQDFIDCIFINNVKVRSFQVDNQILPLGFNEVEGGIGRYQLTLSNGAVIPDEGLAGDAFIFDSPIESSFKFLKAVLPDGNRSVFEAGEIVKINVSQLPPNTLPQYRWYLKTRLGNKGNLSAFSENTGFDIKQVI